MSQHDMVIDNGPGATVRIDLQSALQALASNNSGAGAPGTTYAYMFWADTANGVLKMRNGANNAWITVGSLTADFLGLSVPIWGGTIGGTANAITVTPSPAISGYTTGGVYVFKAVADNSAGTTINWSGLGAKTIKRHGAALVGGEILNGGVYVCVYDGTDMQLQTAPQKASVADVYTGSNDAEFVTSDSLAALWQKGSDIASAATLVKPSDANLGRYHVVTGTTGISALWSGEVAGWEVELCFSGALTITHNGTSLICPNSKDLEVAAGDVVRFKSEGSNNWRVVGVHSVSGASYGMGRHMVWVPAGAMLSTITNGAAYSQIEAATHKNNNRYLAFDTATQEFACFSLAMPKSWDRGTVTFVPIWAAGSGSGGVVWALQAVAISNDDVIDVAYGTEQISSDTLLATTDIHRGPESAAITIAGSPAESDIVQFRVKRNVTDGADTLAADALLLGIELYITTKAGNDA
jgi:hypothetical protein